MIPGFIFDLVVMELEGGSELTNDPDDRGGLTKYGISQRANPRVDVANLTETKANAIYAVKYWRPSNCPALQEYMQLSQFNCAVNCGVGTANKVLQRVVKAKPVDGLIGPKTMQKVREYSFKPRMFVTWYAAWIGLYYFNIAHRRESQVKYIKGWYRRVAVIVYDSAVRFGRRTKK